MSTKKLVFTISKCLPLLAILVFALSACEKDDESYYLFPGKTNLDFGYETNSLKLSIGNIADETINWTISTRESFLEFTTTSGALDPGEQQTINVNLIRSMITNDSISSSVQLTSSKGKNIDIPVFILNYPENKIRLPYSVASADFDATRQLLYILYLESQPGLQIFNITDGTFKTFELDLNYFSSISNLHVMPDGKNLIVYTGSYIYQIDAGTGEIVYSHQLNDWITCVAGTPTQKLYIMTDDWGDNFYCLDLETHNISGVGFYSTYVQHIQIHPSWNYVYGISSYDGLIKISLQGEVPVLVYSMYEYDGNQLWITGGGEKIMTSGKELLSIDPELPGEDVISSIGIESFGYPYVEDVAYNSSDEVYFILFTDQDYYSDGSFSLRMYNSEMAFLRTLNPEPFLTSSNDNGYQSETAYALRIFNNPEQNNLVAITRSATSGYNSTYAIDILDY